MLSNYFKIILRLIIRQRTFAFINIFGLSAGLTGVILIYLYVTYELSYNSHHEKLDRLHLIVRDVHLDNTVYNFLPLPYPFKDAIVSEFPEIENATRYDAFNKFIFSHDNKSFNEPVLVADPEIFEMFTFKYLEGDIRSPLPDAGAVAISRGIAEKYFGNESAIGKTFQINGKHDVRVTFVYDNFPPNSSLKSDIVLNMDFYKTLQRNVTAWNTNNTHTYLLLREGTDVAAFEQKLKPRLAKAQQSTDELFLHPYKDFYLHNFHYKGGPIKYVIIFGLIGVVIIALAAINYVNLVTARSVKRAKEIGIRKSVGAQRNQVVFQLLGESIFFALIALNLAVLAVELLLPWFNAIIEKKLAIPYTDPFVIFVLIAIAVTTGLLAGAYPALQLSRFSPTAVLKSKASLSGGGFKSALVIVQFSVSIALIVVSIVLYKQFKHLINLPTGFNKENIFYFKLEDDPRVTLTLLKKEFGSVSNVTAMAAAGHLPTEIGSNGNGYGWEGKDPNADVLVSSTTVDEGYLNTFGMVLKDGRFFEGGEITLDTTNKVSKIVVNEKMCEVANFKDPIGKSITAGEWRLEIVGVVSDFNFIRNQATIGPLIMFFRPENTQWGFVKFDGDAAAMKGELSRAYQKVFPQYPPDFNLVDDRFAFYFGRENRNAKIFGYFTILAITISCLGLYGLASFIAEQRKKEMAIRKALGAKTSGLSLLMLKDFGKWILISNIIALPIAWYYSDNALKQYVFRTEISIWIFIAAAIVSALVAAATVIFHLTKTARQNPVIVLKYE